MAGLLYSTPTPEISVTPAATAKTVLMLKTATNHRAKIVGVSVFAKGTSPTDGPILCEVYRATSDGTMTAFTPDKDNDDDSETIQSLAYHTATAEPTLNAVPMRRFYVHPQAGAQFYFPFERPITLKGGGSRVALRLTAAQVQTIVASFDVEE